MSDPMETAPHTLLTPAERLALLRWEQAHTLRPCEIAPNGVPAAELTEWASLATIRAVRRMHFASWLAGAGRIGG